MRNTKKAFTLVELIVVITILAILGTIAFISFGGQTAGARNTKVTSDIRNIASAIEVATSGSNPVILFDIVTGSRDREDNRVTGIVGTGVNGGTGATLNATGPSENYTVGNINFASIGQNGDDFKDPNSTNGSSDYLFAVVTIPTFKAYQIAGQIVENDTKKSRINGTYFQGDTTTDVTGLISARTATTPLRDGATIGLGSANDLYNPAP